jgi:hypothetical protein
VAAGQRSVADVRRADSTRRDLLGRHSPGCELAVADGVRRQRSGLDRSVAEVSGLHLPVDDVL